MILVNEVVDYAKRLQQKVTTINYNQTVLDDGQLVKFLKSRSPKDNHLLFMVLPNIDPVGRDDNWQDVNQMALFVFQKYDSSSSHEVFLKDMKETQLTIREVRNQMLVDKTECCNLMQYLDITSIHIEPIRAYAQCQGWYMEFSFQNSF